MSGDPGPVAVRPVFSYPRRARAGQTYLLTIDLLGEDGAPWPYPQEEYTVYCLLKTLPLFEHRAVGSGGMVLHRFGGTYGPAQFLLKACDLEGEGTIRVTLVNGWGVPVSTLDLPGIRVGRGPDFADDPATRRVSLRGGDADTSQGGQVLEPSSPYRGLEPFREQDAALFFDLQDNDAMRIVWDRLEKKGAVVFLEGMPGSGKTSHLRAGVIPRVRQEGMDGRRDWLVVTFQPGRSPSESFLGALRRVEPEVPTRYPLPSAEEFDEQGGDWRELLVEALASLRRPVLVVLDQFEEFYTRCRSEIERVTVMGFLEDLHEDQRNRLLIGIRGEDNWLLGMNERLAGDGLHVVLRPPRIEFLRGMIVTPARVLGYQFQGSLSDNDPRHHTHLVDRILSDPLLAPDPTTGRPDIGEAALGLLELALQRLWLRASARGSKEFTHADYDQVGGLGPALGQWAEEFYLRPMKGALSAMDQTQDIARRVFTGLVSNDRPLLRPRAELEAQTGNPIEAAAVIESLLGAGLLLLLTGSSDPVVPQVTLAHSALIQHWPRLRDWLEGPSPAEEVSTREEKAPDETTPDTSGRSRPAGGRVRAPMFLIPFDKNAKCLDQAARKALVTEFGKGEYTDLVVLTHGWNVDWKAAGAFCERFFTGFLTLYDQSGPSDRPFRPLLAGILWESMAFGPAWEGRSASAPTAARQDVAESEEELRQIAGELKEADIPRFYELAGKSGLDVQEDLELARILAPIYQDLDDPQTPERSPEELVALWKQQREPMSESNPTEAEGSGFIRAGLAGLLQSVLNPLRLMSIWSMLVRAGKIGARGLNPLLRELLDTDTGTRLHLVAHSLGARLMLGALCAETLPRRVDSLLLLQAFVPHLCFARDLTGRGNPGEYRTALDRVELPILTTYSLRDTLLTIAYARVIQVAPPAYLRNVRVPVGPHGLYAALGAVGPQGCEDESHYDEMILPPDRYDVRPRSDIRLVALDGKQYIKGHTDIDNDAVWWALCNLVDPR